MAGHHDPKLLYSISNIQAYHIKDGEEESLTPSGPQTLSLLMVPTSSPFADFGNIKGLGTDASEEDFYLHLNLPPELDLPLPATTQIYHQPPRSYLIPRWDLGPDSGAFTRIEFPTIGKGSNRVSQEDVDTFETILAQCTAFLERAQAPTVDSKEGYKTYNPADFEKGEAYVRGTASINRGEIVLVNEDDGSVLGELLEEATMVEDSKVQPGLKGLCELFQDHWHLCMLTTTQILLRLRSHQMADGLMSGPCRKTTYACPVIPHIATRHLFKTLQQPRA